VTASTDAWGMASGNDGYNRSDSFTTYWRISFADPVAVRHALAMASNLATRDPYAVAMAVVKLALPRGSLQEVLHLHDVLARVYLARLCYTLSRARVLDERPDIKSQFTNILYQLLLDPSERVCFEAIMCILGNLIIRTCCRLG
jgi:hypothetical protein